MFHPSHGHDQVKHTLMEETIIVYDLCKYNKIISKLCYICVITNTTLKDQSKILHLCRSLYGTPRFYPVR
jgi:hypothetical protein